MKKYKNILKNFLLNEILYLRKERNSKFMFLPNDLEFSKLAEILKMEFLKNIEKSDELIIKYTLENLENKRIIFPKQTSISTYSFDNIKYFDVNIKTINNRFFSRGTSTDKNEAYAKAIGEVLERLSINSPTLKEYKTKILTKKIGEVFEDEFFFNLDKCAKPTKEQLDKFPSFNISNEDIFSWTKTKNVFTNKDVYIPSQTIFFGKFEKIVEKELIQPTTHGAGAGFSKHDAFRSCLFEIIHRHHFLKSWYRKNIPSQIDSKSIPNIGNLKNKIEDMEKRGFKMYFLDYTEEADIPTTICILETFGGWSCGGSTNYTLLGSLERSLDEAFSMYLWTSKQYTNKKNIINKDKIEEMLPGYTNSKSSDITSKLLAFSNKYFLEKFDKFIIMGKLKEYTEKNDVEEKNRNFNFIKTIAYKNFGEDIFIFEKENNFLDTYSYHVSKLYIPNSFYFPINDIYTRPIIYDKIQPTFTYINPFP
jgi:thiazole/oxazole-forming peptide maturase SagD family component